MKQRQKYEIEVIYVHGSCTEPNKVIGGSENSANDEVSTPVAEKTYSI